MIPLDYDDCKFPVGGKVIAVKDGKYGILNLCNEILLPFHYDYISNFSADEIAVCKDGKYGVINWQQEPVLPFEYEYTEIVGDGYYIGEAVPLFYPPLLVTTKTFRQKYLSTAQEITRKLIFALLTVTKSRFIHLFPM